MGAALTYLDSSYRCAATWAGFISSAINAEMILKTAAAVDPIDAGAVAANSIFQNMADALPKPLGLFETERVRPDEGMQFGPVQGLIGVDVADPGNELLIQQEGLKLPSPTLEHFVEYLRGEIRTQRLGPEMRE